MADDRRGQVHQGGQGRGRGTASRRDVTDMVSRRPSALRGAAPGGMAPWEVDFEADAARRVDEASVLARRGAHGSLPGRM